MIRGTREEVFETLRNQVRLSHLQKFQVKKGDGGNDYIFKSEESEDPESALTRMEILLQRETGKFSLVGRTNDVMKASNGGFTVDFYLSADEKPSVAGVAQQQATVGMVSVEELDRRLAEAQEQWRREQELERLKEKAAEQEKEIAELKKPINEVIRKLSPLVEPAVGLLARRMMPAASAPATIGRLESEPSETVPVEPYETMPPAEPEMTSEDEDELLALYAQWKEKDADCLEVLRAICKIGISGQPIMGMPYETVKNMIINAAKE